VESALQYRPDPVDPGNPPKLEGIRPAVADEMGADSFLGEGFRVAAQMINARSETADTKPAFRDALKTRRCLIPADGFYEWKRDGKAKQPYCFEVNEAELFGFARLWDRWKDPNGKWIETCSILTTTPNAVTAPVHDRMPVILDRDSYDLWLDPGMQNVAEASELLKPFDARQLRCYLVSSRINRVMNDDAGCSAPVELSEIQDRLFT
jgi:putative SOS response-associated peptidase YedK